MLQRRKPYTLKMSELVGVFENLGFSARHYVKDVKTGIRQTEKPSGQSSEIYDKIVKHINEGNLVAMAGLAKCSADMKFYVFKIGQDGPQLIESAAIGSMQCLSK